MLRLRAMVARMGRRVAYGAVSLVFLLAVLVFVHILGWHALAESAGLGFYASTCIVGGVDLLLALIFLAMASSSSQSSAEREAYEVRQQAIAGMRRAGNLAQLALPTLRVASRFRRRRR